MFRAKFRVLRKTESVHYPYVDGKPVPTKRVTVQFWPVNAKNQWEPNGSEENLAFWSATPSGECELELSPEESEAYEIGQAFYIDFEPKAGADWHLAAATTMFGHGPQVEVALHPNKGTGKLKMNVQRPETVRHLANCVDYAVTEGLAAASSASAPVAPRWSVTFMPVPG